jgi:exodeoxyribonuclease VII large subunit
MLERLSPAHRIDTYRQRLDEIAYRQKQTVQVGLERKQFKLRNLQQSLKSLNPIAVLNRGYAIVTRTEDNSLIKNPAQVHIDDVIHIRVSQGSMDAQITKTNPGE